MSAAAIAAALGGARREGRAWRARCPLHGGRSLTLRDGEGGQLLAWCFGGCAARDVLAELRRRGLLDQSHHGGGVHRVSRRIAPIDVQRDDEARTTRALALLREARPAAGSIVENYLLSRGITIAPPPTLLFHPRCPHPSGAMLPAMIALVQRVARGSTAIHRTFLRPDGSGKAAIEPDKASLGPVGSGAVRLGAPRKDQWLVVGEGIETTLSVIQACALPGWAALSASGVRSLVLPPSVRLVLIAADNDENGVGQAAADDAAERFIAEGRRVRVFMPPIAGSDWNDVVAGNAPARVEEVNDAA